MIFNFRYTDFLSLEGFSKCFRCDLAKEGAGHPHKDDLRAGAGSSNCVVCRGVFPALPCERGRIARETFQEDWVKSWQSRLNPLVTFPFCSAQGQNSFPHCAGLMTSPFASTLCREELFSPFVDSAPLPCSSACQFLAVSSLPQMLFPGCPVLPQVLLEALHFYHLRPHGDLSVG